LLSSTKVCYAWLSKRRAWLVFGDGLVQIWPRVSRSFSRQRRTGTISSSGSQNLMAQPDFKTAGPARHQLPMRLPKDGTLALYFAFDHPEEYTNALLLS